MIFGCQPKEKHVVSKTISEKLSFRIDPSIDTLSVLEKEETANQILINDPSNYLALIIKSVNAINSNNTKSAINYFRTLIQHNEVDPYVFVLLSICYEKENIFDSARITQEIALEKYYEVNELSADIARLEAILNGKEKALAHLNKILAKNTMNSQLLILENDINNYQDQGILEFFPVYFDDLLTGDFEIRNTELGKLNLKDSEIESYFARHGINVMVYEVNLEGKFVRLKTIQKYIEAVENFAELEIKRL